MTIVLLTTSIDTNGIDVRVLVLGRSPVAEVTVETIATHPGVQDIQMRWADPGDPSGIRTALNNVDVVVNAVDPDRSGSAVLEAAIDTGTHYLDACDDCDYVARMLGLDSRAKAAGICAVIGMGTSPGVTNLLASCAAGDLDSISDIYIAWPVDAPEGNVDVDIDDPLAAATRWMHQLSGTSTVVRSGRLGSEQPLRPVTLELPRGRHGTAYTAGGPEPISLFHTLAPAGDCTTLMVVAPGTAAYLDVLRRDIDRKRLTPKAAAEQLDKPTMWRTLRSLVSASRFKAPGTLPPFFAAVSGIKDGRQRLVMAGLVDNPHPAGPAPLTASLARSIGIPLGLALFQLIDAVNPRAGVHPPEVIIEPHRFFDDLDHCLNRPGYAPSLFVEHTDCCR